MARESRAMWSSAQSKQSWGEWKPWEGMILSGRGCRVKQGRRDGIEQIPGLSRKWAAPHTGVGRHREGGGPWEAGRMLPGGRGAQASLGTEPCLGISAWRGTVEQSAVGSALMETEFGMRRKKGP